MPNIYQSHKAIYNNVKTIEELNLKGLLVFLLNRVEKAVSSGGETKGALIVICFNGRKSDKRIGKENYKIELFVFCMHIDHVYWKSNLKPNLVCGNFRMEFVKM